MKSLVFFCSCFLLSNSLFSQKYMTQNGTITFFSEAPVENIEAVNRQVSGVIDTESGEIAFSLLMKAFTFEKALMQEHFNEKYVHSDKYPKATFKGQLLNFSKSSLSSESKVFNVKGTLTIHGKSKEIQTTARLKKEGEKIVGESAFSVNLADFDVNIPSAVVENIAETIDIKVDMNYAKL